jgi:hypothetical protein
MPFDYRHDSAQLRLRIDAVERDPDPVAERSGFVPFRSWLPAGPGTSCATPAAMGQQGSPLAFHPRRPRAPRNLRRRETAKARGKCVRVGYLPSQDDAMRDLYYACIRMIRAELLRKRRTDHPGWHAHHIYNDRGIQTLDQQSLREVEADWTAGAVCARPVRIKENISFDALAQRCPRLKHSFGSACTEERARSLGASLFNRCLPLVRRDPPVLLS